MTIAMRERAMAGAQSCGLGNVDVRDGDAMNLPVEDSTVDVVISNGVLNLVPDKNRAVREIARVLNPVDACRSRISSLAKSFPTARFETSTSGPVESPVLCWKQSSSASSRPPVSRGYAFSTGSIASPVPRRNVQAKRYGVVGVNLTATRS